MIDFGHVMQQIKPPYLAEFIKLPNETILAVFTFDPNICCKHCASTEIKNC